MLVALVSSLFLLSSSTAAITDRLSIGGAAQPIPDTCTLDAVDLKPHDPALIGRVFGITAHCNVPYRVVYQDPYTDHVHTLIDNDHGGDSVGIVVVPYKRPALGLVNEHGDLL